MIIEYLFIQHLQSLETFLIKIKKKIFVSLEEKSKGIRKFWIILVHACSQKAWCILWNFDYVSFISYHFYFFLFPNYNTKWACPVSSWFFSSNFRNFPPSLVVYFAFISWMFFFNTFYILFLPDPLPWNIADWYLNAYFGFISWPLAFRYSNITLSPGLLISNSWSFDRPNCS